MRISASTVAMTAASEYMKTSAVTTENITKFHGNGFVNTSVSASKAITYEHSGQSASLLFDSGKQLPQDAEKKDVFVKTEDVKEEKQQDSEPQKLTLNEHIGNISSAISEITGEDENPKLQALKRMLKLLQQMQGKRLTKTDLMGMKSFKTTAQSVSLSMNQGATINVISSSRPSGASDYWTRQTVTSAFEEGSQNMSFSTTGKVTTEDGRSIDFGVSMELSRSFSAKYTHISAEQEYTVTDPLVINMKGNSAEVSDMKFMFDLNNDGKEESISSLKSGSGFLALDKNKDGAINNGGELFGAKTGNGFAELMEYDEDNNGWIDENDSVFEQLSVWTKGENGENELLALSKAGVGAIFLGSACADYTLTDSAGKEAAYVRSTGVFLHENGNAGTIQHIDFRA